jgi:hypothetical protein
VNVADEDLKEKYKTVKVEITTVDTPGMEGPLPPPSGWGHDARKVMVEGKVVEIMIRRDGEDGFGGAEFGIRILEDGSVILTSYNSMLTTSLCERNLRLTNERPWK